MKSKRKGPYPGAQYSTMMSPESLSKDGRGGFVDHAEEVAKQRECAETRGPASLTTIRVTEVTLGVDGSRTKTQRLVSAGLPGNPRMPGDHDFVPSAETKRHIQTWIRQTRIERQMKAIKEWRSERGASVRHAATEETIKKIVLANPSTVEELLTIPGVSEMLADVAGREIIMLLSRT